MSIILLKKLLRELRDRKGQLLALILITVVGISTFIGMGSVYLDLVYARDAYFQDFDLADFQITVKRAPENILESLSESPNVKNLRGRISTSSLIYLKDKIRPISGTALSLPLNRKKIVNDVLLRSGTWFSGTDETEVIINESFAIANNIKPGERLKVNIYDNEHNLIVVGTALSPEYIYIISDSGGFAPDPEMFGVLYLTEDFLAKQTDMDGAFNQLVGIAHRNSKGEITNTLTLLEEKLDSYGVIQSARTDELPSIRYFLDELEGLQVGTRVVPVIFLAFVALVLNILMGRYIAQQRTIIGTLKALGYSNIRIALHYTYFSVIVGLAGGFLGALAGYWMQTSYVELYKQMFALPAIPVTLHPEFYLTGIFLSVSVCIMGALLSASRAMKLNPAKAMKPPAPPSGKEILLSRIRFFWNPLPFKLKLIFRSIFRSPFRTLVTFFATVVSTALVLSMTTMFDSMNYLIDHEFSKSSHQDITLTLREPCHLQGLNQIEGLNGVTLVEPELAVPCDMWFENRTKRSAITGILPGNVLHTPFDENDKPVVIPPKGIVLSTKLAQILDCKPGDILTIRPLFSDRKIIRAPISGTVNSLIGLSAFADLSYLSSLLNEEMVMNTVLVATGTRGASKSFLRELKEIPIVSGMTERSRTLGLFEQTFGDTMGVIFVLMIVLSATIAFGSVLNSTLVSLSERSQEVGTLRVLGYTAKDVTSIFAGESIIVNTVGIFLGLYGGVLLGKYLSIAYDTELYRFPLIVYTSRYIHTVLIMLFFLVLSNLIVARVIRKLNWLDSLKIRE